MTTRGLRIAVVCVAALAGAALLASAEEGMWTFDNPPLKLLKAKYGFVPTQAWLDHLRLSCVRLNDGGSGSFVSADGLLLTNHHVARGQLQKNSTAEHDYLRDGFYAPTPEQEMKSPDLEINVLVSMEDVTARVQGAAKGIKNEAAALKAREAEIAKIEKESMDATKLRSDVVGLYQGGEYWLYRYKVYRDVRLVFAPEQQAAFFGGDPDNFTYPRYDLDMALFRVYDDDGKPLHTENYLKWSAKGAAPGELIFISGHPGATSRQDTVAQLEVERDLIEPAAVEYLTRRIAAAEKFAAQGPEQARLVGSTIFGLQNSLKVYVGRQEALKDPAIMAKKRAEEEDFRSKVAANPEWQRMHGSAWATIAAAEERVKPEVKYQLFRRTDSRLFSMALNIVQLVAEEKKPDGDRLPQFHEAGLGALKFQLESPAPIPAEVDKAFMKSALMLAEEKLGKNDAFVQAILEGGDVDATVDSLVGGTKLGDAAYRKSLIDGGAAAVAASTDPMIAAARRVDPIARATTRRLRDTI